MRSRLRGLEEELPAHERFGDGEVAHRLVGVTGEGADALDIGAGKGVPVAAAVGGEDLPVGAVPEPAGERRTERSSCSAKNRPGSLHTCFRLLSG